MGIGIINNRTMLTRNSYFVYAFRVDRATDKVFWLSWEWRGKPRHKKMFYHWVEVKESGLKETILEKRETAEKQKQILTRFFETGRERRQREFEERCEEREKACGRKLNLRGYEGRGKSLIKH